MKKLYFLLTICIILGTFSGCGKEEEIIVEEITEKRASFYGVGDNLIHNCLYWQADKNKEGDDFDFKPMYAGVCEEIKNADIAYINQETILGGTELTLSSYPLFNSPKELGRDMIDLGFDVFSHATNHVFDKGEQGIINTYEFYSKNPDVTMVGIYKKDEEFIKITEKNGIKIAFINYTFHTNGMGLKKNSEYYVPVIKENNYDELINLVKDGNERADFVVCLMHWGDEDVLTPNETQKECAKILSESGCDVIIGTHTHSIQPFEYIGDTLVVYSLGNFISAQKNPVNLIGGTIKFELVVKGNEKFIENIEYMPVITQYEGSFKNIRIIPFSDYTVDDANRHGVNITYDYIENVIKNTIDSKYLKH